MFDKELKAVCLTWFVVLALNTLSGHTQSSRSGRSGSFAPSDEVLFGLIADAKRLNRHSSEERFEALISLLDEYQLDYEVQKFSTKQPCREDRYEGRNVVVTFGTGTQTLVVGAHFDAFQLPDGSTGPGMVDNASGVIVLIRVANAVRNYPFKNQIRFVFFDMEELGLVGSQRFVQSSTDVNIVAMLNVDMVGYGDTVVFGPSVGGDEQASRILRICCAKLSIDCFSSPRLPPGDQDSFRKMNIPALSLAILPSLEAHQAWLLINEAKNSGLRNDFEPAIAQVIHTERDTFEKLDPLAMTTAYRLLRTVLLRLDAAVQ